MKNARKLFWLLVLATTLVYGAMIFWAGPIISNSSDGGMPFDLRMFGYSHSEAQAFLAALTPAGTAFYLGSAMWLDTFFPAMFALVLAIGCWILLASRPLIMRVATSLMAAGYALFDYLENAAVARMLEAGPDQLSEILVATASRWTVLKFFFVDAAITVLIVLLIAKFIAHRANKVG